MSLHNRLHRHLFDFVVFVSVFVFVFVYVLVLLLLRDLLLMISFIQHMEDELQSTSR